MNILDSSKLGMGKEQQAGKEQQVEHMAHLQSFIHTEKTKQEQGC